MYRLFLVALLATVLAIPFQTDETSENVSVSENNQISAPCDCSGPECQCCVDFNLTFVDLGGPGCVRMKYLSQQEGILLNVSYGDSQLHGEQIKEAKVSCMDLLLDLAQMCARIENVAITDEGMRACANLEPTFLGDPQDSYNFGCFIMGPQGMKLINTTSNSQQAVAPAVEEETKPEVSEESLIAAVNESAEEGIAWFSSFLGLSFGKSNITETATEPSNQ